MKYLRPSILLFMVAFLAYGILIPQLGFYWDDLPISWIRYQLGSEALTRYFSTNRPVWGVLYQLTTRIIPQVPEYWQIFALLWRWLGAVVVYANRSKIMERETAAGWGVAWLFRSTRIPSHGPAILWAFTLSLSFNVSQVCAAIIASAMARRGA